MFSVADLQLLSRLGQNVRRARKRRGLTVAERASRAGLSVRFVLGVEGGAANIAITRLAALAGALDASLDELLSTHEAPKDRVALVGLRGAGKSSVGVLLAEGLGLPFIELDHRVEAAAGLTLAELFSLHGDPYYRRLEAEELARINEPCVLATSGGIVENPDAWPALQRRFTTVWLSAPPEAHMERVQRQGDHRPMRDRADAMAELRALLARRAPEYARAQLHVDTRALDARGAARAVLEVLASDNPGDGE